MLKQFPRRPAAFLAAGEQQGGSPGVQSNKNAPIDKRLTQHVLNQQNDHRRDKADGGVVLAIGEIAIQGK